MATNPVSSIATPYDEVAYPGQLHFQTHPERLAAMGLLHGLQPAPVTRCRVLEVGCGAGDNLIPMAWTLPDSQFTGVDLAETAIARGRPLIEHLQLKNCRLLAGDLTRIDASWGEFDYIIAHGVYSWVPAPVRDRLLALCRECLAPQGLAFISYTVYPGAHLSMMLREMMQHHVNGFPEPIQKMRQAVALVRLIAGARLEEDPAHVWVRKELARFEESNPAQVFHDELAPTYAPCYFHEFMANARQQGLQFVGETDVEAMADVGCSPDAREALAQLGDDRERREQYIDFLECRRFRQTILTPAGNRVRSTPDAASLSRMWIGLRKPIEAEHRDLTPGRHCRFTTPPAGQVEIDLPLGKAALLRLADAHPHPMPQSELLSAARSDLAAAGLPPADDPADEATLNDLLLRLAQHGLVRLHSWQPRLPRHPGPQPEVNPIARWQIRHRPLVTSLRHHSIQITDAVGMLLVELLDGSRDVAALPDLLSHELQRRRAVDVGHASPQSLTAEISAQLPANLQKLADLGLLIK